MNILLVLSLACQLSLTQLVGPSNPLPSDAGPIAGQVEAQVNLSVMQTVAGWEGITFKVTSGHRPYHVQAHLVREDPSNRAAPGHSEHQLGTAFDVSSKGYSYWTNPSNEQLWAWLQGNAHKFGFVISYPYKECDTWPFNNSTIAGCRVDYISEPWHIRYVGHQLAEEIVSAGYLEPHLPVIPQDFYTDACE